jgi:hypothetical protein
MWWAGAEATGEHHHIMCLRMMLQPEQGAETMTAESRQQAMQRRITEMWGGGNLALIGAIAAPTFVFNAPGQPSANGLAELNGPVTMRHTAFPEMSNPGEALFACGRTLVTRGVTTACAWGRWDPCQRSANLSLCPG